MGLWGGPCSLGPGTGSSRHSLSQLLNACLSLVSSSACSWNVLVFFSVSPSGPWSVSLVPSPGVLSSLLTLSLDVAVGLLLGAACSSALAPSVLAPLAPRHHAPCPSVPTLSSLLSPSLFLPVSLNCCLPLIASVAQLCCCHLSGSASVLSLHLSWCCPSLSAVSASVYPSLPSLSVCAVLPRIASVTAFHVPVRASHFLPGHRPSSAYSPAYMWSALPTPQLQCLGFCSGGRISWSSPACGLVSRWFSVRLVCCVCVLDGGAGWRVM